MYRVSTKATSKKQKYHGWLRLRDGLGRRAGPRRGGRFAQPIRHRSGVACACALQSPGLANRDRPDPGVRLLGPWRSGDVQPGAHLPTVMPRYQQ
eukprot:scaffold24918_cov131-Isochrysis_galbana.AAC.3